MKIPVRVVRGSELNGKYAPNKGYRYDGLYWVTKIFTDFKSKRNIYQFRLVQLDLSNYTIPVHEEVRKQVQPKNPIQRIKKEKPMIILDDDHEEVKQEEKIIVKEENKSEKTKQEENKTIEKQEENKTIEKQEETKEVKITTVPPLSERELKELNNIQDPSLLSKIKEIKKKKNIFKVRDKSRHSQQKYKIINSMMMKEMTTMLELSIQHQLPFYFEESIQECIEYKPQDELFQVYYILYGIFTKNDYILQEYRFQVTPSQWRLYSLLCQGNYVALEKLNKNKQETEVYQVYSKEMKEKQEVYKKYIS
jgi:hypothetical protein